MRQQSPYAPAELRVPSPPKPDSQVTGGEGGIRTPDRLAPMPHFECGAFDHSATSPGANNGATLPLRSGRVLGEDGGSDKAREARISEPSGSNGGRQAWDRQTR